MHIHSLFSGIGGLELGLEDAGLGEVVTQVELDPFRRSILARHWPAAERHADITEVDFGTYKPGGVLCGGFPCQDISNAGDRAGLAGERSGLWREYLRAVRVVGPELVVVENVAALTSRGLSTVLGDLAASRYDAEWDCLPAGAFGAPHLRDRCFVLAHPDAQSVRQQPEPQPRSEGKTFAPDDGPQGAAAHADGVRQLQPEGFQPESWGRPSHSPWWAAEPPVARVVHGLPPGVDRPKREAALGLAVSPIVARHLGRIGRRILERRGVLTQSPPASGRKEPQP